MMMMMKRKSLQPVLPVPVPFLALPVVPVSVPAHAQVPVLVPVLNSSTGSAKDQSQILCLMREGTKQFTKYTERVINDDLNF